MNSEAEPSEFDPGQTVVLNALIDLYADETVVLDGDSERRLREVVDAVTSPDERSVIREEVDRLSRLEEGESADLVPELYRFVEGVTDGLAERGYSITVRHEYRQQLPPLDAHVYSFVNTGDVRRLRALELDPAVEDPLVEGMDLLEEGADERARSTFSAAVDRAAEHTEEVAARIVAGWGYFRTGDDDAALEHVRDALELEDSSWAARVVGAAVKRDENDFIRSGKKSAGIILRWVVSESADTSTLTELGGRSDGEEMAWTAVDHLQGHAFLDRVHPETWLRFTLRGTLPEFPRLQVYFLGLGVYDNEMDYIETVIDRFGTGPHNTGSVERISIDR